MDDGNSLMPNDVTVDALQNNIRIRCAEETLATIEIPSAPLELRRKPINGFILFRNLLFAALAKTDQFLNYRCSSVAGTAWKKMPSEVKDKFSKTVMESKHSRQSEKGRKDKRQHSDENHKNIKKRRQYKDRKTVSTNPTITTSRSYEQCTVTDTVFTYTCNSCGLINDVSIQGKYCIKFNCYVLSSF